MSSSLDESKNSATTESESSTTNRGRAPSLSQPLHVLVPVNFNEKQVNGGIVKKIFTADRTGCILDFCVVADDVVLQIGVYLVFL